MRLYLSSYQLGNESERLAELVGDNPRVALVLNASDVYGDGKRPQYVERFREDFAALGLTAEELDLRKYFDKPEELKAELTRFGMVWASGGNTFVLRRAMRASGLDKILPPLLKNTDLVYGGFSAGACVVCPSLRGIHLADEPTKVPAGYAPEVLWEGLGLVDFHIVPHYRSPHPESAMMEDVVAYCKEHGMPYHALVDGEAVVVDGQHVEVVGRDA